MRDKADHYTIQAKREGYPARSVYKLKEIQEKHAVFQKGHKILDIGAAPGSWSLYILRNLKGTGKLVAVDLQAVTIEASGNYEFFLGDVFAEENIEKLKALGPFDAIVSDAAPATTGNRTVDCGRSYSLVEGILSLCQDLLKPEGNLVCKIFQGSDEQKLLKQMQQGFQKARAFKPKSCRKESFETFFVAHGFKNPQASVH